MVGIKGFGLGILGKKKDISSSSTRDVGGVGSRGAFNINYDAIEASHDAAVAGKMIDRLFKVIGDSVDRDGNRTSKTLKDLFLTDDVKNGIKEYVMKNDNMVKELLKGIKEDLEIKE